MVAQADNTTPFDAAQYAQGIRATLPYHDAIYSEVISLVGILQPQAKIWLDTGCGDGVLIEKALPYFPETMFHLADPAEKMLAQARERLAGAPAERIKIVGAVGTESLVLPGEARADVITAILSHHYFDREQRRKATERCFELLADGGLYITFENICPDSEPGVDIALRRWAAYQLAQGRSPDDVRQHMGRFNTSYFPIRRDEHLALLKECGFRVAEQFWLSCLQGGFYAIK